MKNIIIGSEFEVGNEYKLLVLNSNKLNISIDHVTFVHNMLWIHVLFHTETCSCKEANPQIVGTEDLALTGFEDLHRFKLRLKTS